MEPQEAPATINPPPNMDLVAPGDHVYNTDLGEHEPAFRDWVGQNKVPFDVNAPVSDYDMRGFYRALQSGDERAVSATNQNDGAIHYPDYWKTPYHKTFSAESQWANPQTAPRWNDMDQLIAPDGRIVYDERAEAAMRKNSENRSAASPTPLSAIERLQQHLRGGR